MSGRKMPNSPSSASKGFSSTPLKYSGGRDVLRSRSVEEDLVSSDEDTYSLLSPIYHDSFDSDEDLGDTSQHQHHPDTSRVSEGPRPSSPVRCELPRRLPGQTLTVTMEPAVSPSLSACMKPAISPSLSACMKPAISPSLSAWEAWLVSKAKDERLKLDKKAEEERLRKEREEKEEREMEQKRMLVEEKIQVWLKMKREQEKQEKQRRQSREQEEEERQQEKQRQTEQRAQERYREWLRKKNQEKMERDNREQEEEERRKEQEKERRRRAEEKFKEWLSGDKEKNRTSPKSPGYPGSPYDKAYPEPSFYNPIPWKPIHVPRTEQPQKKTLSRKKGQSQARCQPSLRAACRLRDSGSVAQRR